MPHSLVDATLEAVARLRARGSESRQNHCSRRSGSPTVAERFLGGGRIVRRGCRATTVVTQQF
jgi:hypothetical protein